MLLYCAIAREMNVRLVGLSLLFTILLTSCCEECGHMPKHHGEIYCHENGQYYLSISSYERGCEGKFVPIWLSGASSCESFGYNLSFTKDVGAFSMNIFFAAENPYEMGQSHLYVKRDGWDRDSLKWKEVHSGPFESCIMSTTDSKYLSCPSGLSDSTLEVLYLYDCANTAVISIVEDIVNMVKTSCTLIRNDCTEIW